MTTFPDRFFVTGTDTDVGKTVVCTLLMLALPCRYLKPVQSGTEDGTDTLRVQQLSGLGGERFVPECYVTRTSASPHLSARLDGITIDPRRISQKIAAIDGPLLVEGAGGIYVPLNEQDMILDLMQLLALPVILVARSGLGTINHTLLSIQALRQAGINLYGVIMNGPLNPENRRAIETFGSTRVITEIPSLCDLSLPTLRSCAATLFTGEHL